MNTKSLIVLAGLAAATLAATPAFAAKYTCDDTKPCIVQADELGKHRVDLKWTGKGKAYTFFKIIVRTHGGGPVKEIKVPGGKNGHGRFNLGKPGDYEITVAGCNVPHKKGEAPVCNPSSEKVRLNLR